MELFSLFVGMLIVALMGGCSKSDDERLSRRSEPMTTPSAIDGNTVPGIATNRMAATNAADGMMRSTTNAALNTVNNLAPRREGLRPQDVARTGNDAVIVSRILTNLGQLDSNVVAAVQIQVMEGNVTLGGTVATAEQRDSVEQTTKSSEGVKQVQNNIKVENTSKP